MYNLQRSTNTPESTLLAINSHILAENIQTNFEAADLRSVAFFYDRDGEEVKHYRQNRHKKTPGFKNA